MAIRLTEIESRDVFGRASEAGLSPQEIEEWMKGWAPPHADDHPDPGERRKLYRINPAVQNLLATIGITYGETVGRYSAEIPLAIVQAPPGPDCKIKYSEVIGQGYKHAWSFRLAGVGTEADQELAVESTTSFYSTDGQVKMAFLPIRIESRRAKFVRNGRVLREFVSRRLKPAPADDVFIRDASTDDLDRWSADEDRGVIQQAVRMNLSEARSGKPVTAKRKYEAKGEYTSGFKYEDAGNTVEMKVKVTASHAVEVEIEVPEGATYVCRVRIGSPNLAVGITKHR